MGVLGNHDQNALLANTRREGAAPGRAALVGRQFLDFREDGLKLTVVNTAPFCDFDVANLAAAKRQYKSDRKDQPHVIAPTNFSNR